MRSKTVLRLVILASSFSFGIAMLIAAFLAIPLEKPGVLQFFYGPGILFLSLLPHSATQSISDAGFFWTAIASVVVGWAIVGFVFFWVLLQSMRWRRLMRH